MFEVKSQHATIIGLQKQCCSGACDQRFVAIKVTKPLKLLTAFMVVVQKRNKFSILTYIALLLSWITAINILLLQYFYQKNWLGSNKQRVFVSVNYTKLHNIVLPWKTATSNWYQLKRLASRSSSGARGVLYRANRKNNARKCKKFYKE